MVQFFVYNRIFLFLFFYFSKLIDLKTNDIVSSEIVSRFTLYSRAVNIFVQVAKTKFYDPCDKTAMDHSIFDLSQINLVMKFF